MSTEASVLREQAHFDEMYRSRFVDAQKHHEDMKTQLVQQLKLVDIMRAYINNPDIQLWGFRICELITRGTWCVKMEWVIQYCTSQQIAPIRFSIDTEPFRHKYHRLLYLQDFHLVRIVAVACVNVCAEGIQIFSKNRLDLGSNPYEFSPLVQTSGLSLRVGWRNVYIPTWQEVCVC